MRPGCLLDSLAARSYFGQAPAWTAACRPPDEPLVIRGVALPHVALVTRLIVGVIRAQRAQPERRPQFSFDDVEHALRALGREQRDRQAARGKNLVRAQRRVDAAGLVIDVD